MPIKITWADSCEEIEKLQTPAVTVKVHRKGDVITLSVTGHVNPSLVLPMLLFESY